MAEILVVDDDPVMQMTVGRVFEQAGHAVVAANDSAKRLAKSQAEALDLVIPDVFMPDRDGSETTPRVPQQQPDLAIITTSGLPRTPDSMQEPDDPTMATKPGAIGALSELFKPAALLAMIADCLTSSSPSAAQSRAGP